MTLDGGNWSLRNEWLEWKQPQCIGWSVGAVMIISLHLMAHVFVGQRQL